MSRPVRKIFQKALLAVGGVLVALVLLELGARLLPPPYDDVGDTADVCSNQLGWRGRPLFETTVATDDYVHDLRLNGDGMHDEAHTQPKPENTYRILMLGDSFIRAHQVRHEETAHQVLEDLLNGQDSSQHFEVISAGVDAWGTGQELLYYRSEGRDYQPDLALLMFYIGNDIGDNLPGRGLTLNGRNCYTPYFVLCGGQLDAAPWLFAPGVSPPIDECPFGKKVLSNVLGRIYQSSRLYAQLEPLVATSPPGVSAMEYYVGDNEYFEYALQLTIALIKQLEEEVRKDGGEFAVVLISPSDLVEFTLMSSSEREVVYQRLPFMRRAEEIPSPNQFLAEELSSEGIQVLDLLPPFVEYSDRAGELLRFEQDKHWNVAGNRLAAESIYNWLNETYELQ